MEQLFRSRGIKVRVEKKESHRMKLYYEPYKELLTLNSEVASFSERFSCLEYAVSDGKIDAINFHTNCKNIDDISTEFKCDLIESMSTVFDSSYRPYTFGYRINGGKSVYFYPTVWKGERFGISGITDKRIIEQQIERFLLFISVSDKCRSTICSYVPYITKFKGICITNYQKINSYKMYFRMAEQDAYKILPSFLNIEQHCNDYGALELISLSIHKGEISSYNLYFLS